MATPTRIPSLVMELNRIRWLVVFWGSKKKFNCQEKFRGIGPRE